MTGEKGKYAPTFSMRLTLAERAKLDKEAGPLPLGEYIRACMLQSPDTRKRVFRRPVQDDEALSEVLAALGQSRLSSNLNQMTKAIHTGSLPVSPEVEQALLGACSEVHQMRQWLMKALGHLADDQGPPQGVP